MLNKNIHIACCGLVVLLVLWLKSCFPKGNRFSDVRFLGLAFPPFVNLTS